jgi:hypothetical protein
MKLTTEQIECINQILIAKGLNFDDLKVEVLDHIATEIEEKMQNANCAFDVAFKEVLEKWEPEFKPSFSGFIGFTNPRIMTVKCHKIVKRQFLTAIATSSLLTLVFLLFVRNSSLGLFLADIQGTLRSVVLLEFGLVALAWILIWKSKHQTTYSYLMKKKSAGIMIFLLMMGIGLFPVKVNHPDVKIAFVSVFAAIAYIFITGIYLKLAYKHFEFVKKISLVKP